MSKTTNYLFRLDMLILSTLEKRDMYGYEFSKRIEKITSGRIVPKQGTMYPIIRELLEKNYISSYTELVNNKARVYYHLEDSGRDYLDKIKKEYYELVECINKIIDGGVDNE